MCERIYIDVIAWSKQDGTKQPLKFLVYGQSYHVSKVQDVRQAASLNAGGEGVRYTCVILVPIDDVRVQSKHIYLFNRMEGTEDKWFVEGDQARALKQTA